MERYRLVVEFPAANDAEAEEVMARFDQCPNPNQWRRVSRIVLAKEGWVTVRRSEPKDGTTDRGT